MSLIIFALTILVMIISFVYYPKITVKKHTFNTHWIIITIGALLSILFGLVDLKTVFNILLSSSEINPLKLIILFISMTILSIFLNEIGFFKSLSLSIMKHVKDSQVKMFTIFYFLVSILTVFISNDVIILTLTPLMIYFSKYAKINPLPYLFALLVGANTLSLTLLIGNPTNIYLSTMQNITFIEYLKVMAPIGITAGLSSYIVLLLIFKKDLKKPFDQLTTEIEKVDFGSLIIGLFHLITTLILLILSNVISIQMWLITLIAAISLVITSAIYFTISKKTYKPLISSLIKAPWSFIPLILSMYVLVESLNGSGFPQQFGNFLNNYNPILGYGFTSFIASNVMNNLPMSMFYALTFTNPNELFVLKATYATIIGSNLGVLLTPFGALAGLMWLELLKQNGIELKLTTYIKKLFILSFIVLAACLLVLMLIFV